MGNSYVKQCFIAIKEFFSVIYLLHKCNYLIYFPEHVSLMFLKQHHPLYSSFHLNGNIRNFFSKEHSTDELNLLCSGLRFSIPSLKLQKADFFCSFEKVHQFMRQALRNDTDKPALKAYLSHLVNSYLYNYKPTKITSKKYLILQKLCWDIVSSWNLTKEMVACNMVKLFCI